jgi:hypothetical protein
MNSTLRAIHNPSPDAGRQKPKMGKFKAALLVAATVLSMEACVFRHVPPAEMQHYRHAAAQTHNSFQQTQNGERSASQPEGGQDNPTAARSAP